MNYNGSGLVSSANEFVPGQYGAASNFQTNSELNSSANEWVPGGAMSSRQSGTGLNNMSDVGLSLQDTTDQSTVGNENMVEVYWNGTAIFVPESATYMGEDGTRVYMGADGDATPAAHDGVAAQSGTEGVAVEPVEEQPGLQWANFATSLPAPPKRSLQTIGIPEPVRTHFRNMDLDALRQMNPDCERYKELPMRYHSAYPLYNIQSSSAAAQGEGSSCFGYPTALYKATDQMDSQIYALRRFDNVRTSASVVNNVVQRWHEIRHPGIVSLYGVVQEKGALFFSYMYHASAQSLKERFIDQRGPLLVESLIWRLLIQLLSATRYVHMRGLAVRVIEPAHIILTSGTCARYSTVGVLDIVEFETRKTPVELQHDDLIKLGRVVLSLMTRAVITAKNVDDALSLMKQSYSNDLQRVVLALLSGKLTVFQICNHQTVCERMQEEYDTAMAATDSLHSLLRNEYENSRILRLMLKLGFINERPTDPHNTMLPNWSETGDQYVLKLFRDHVFHQIDGDGLPILDAGHVLTALNKLDAGDSEEILLSSRDGKDLLVVSYADVQRCLESSFMELSQQSQVALSNAAAGSNAAGMGMHGMGGHRSGHHHGHGSHHAGGPPLHGQAGAAPYGGGRGGRGGRSSSRGGSSNNLAAMGGGPVGYGTSMHMSGNNPQQQYGYGAYGTGEYSDAYGMSGGMPPTYGNAPGGGANRYGGNY